ncbi:MFS general substrate transporter [Gonapodya prolifera JEL478]|uniref:MFS general substrate transporter n=1 Tax=Gonapodya prolifera (strain JEL478) TaxID=1344416 RepID=A0A139AF86_GONPJ|nr:MFS general substrate transporter [Gonapodya prolifera JEL478]|eukprot:KXS15349.1 MFS general substrate transporter [Gonapodya prolifera JEL478]
MPESPARLETSASTLVNHSSAEPDGQAALLGEKSAEQSSKADTSEPNSPQRWSDFVARGPPLVRTPMRKNIILSIVALSGLLGPLTSAIYTPALTIVQNDFATTDLLINLTITVATLTLGVAPLGWATVADSFGRRPVLLLASLVAVAGCLGCYYSSTIVAFLVWRVVQSAGCSAGMSVGAGVIADIFEKEQRGRAMGTFMLGPILGPVISPPIGGALAQSVGWRYIFIFCSAYALCIFLVTLLFLPETLTPLAPGAARPSRNPFTSFSTLAHPFVFTMQFVTTVAFASFYTFPPLVPRDWPQVYGFDSAGVGFVMMAMGLGMVIGTVVGGYVADYSLARWKRKRGGVSIAEDRLWSSAPGWILLPAGMVAYGWLLQGRVAWPATMTAAIVIGLGQLFFNTSCNTYLVDIYQSRAASITALGNFLRFSLGAFMPLIVVPAASMNRGELYTILAGIISVGVVGVYATARWGTVWRMRAQPWRERADREEVLRAWRGEVGVGKGKGDDETVA